MRMCVLIEWLDIQHTSPPVLNVLTLTLAYRRGAVSMA